MRRLSFVLGLIVCVASCTSITGLDRFRLCEGVECRDDSGTNAHVEDAHVEDAHVEDVSACSPDAGRDCDGGVAADAPDAAPKCSARTCKGTCCGDECVEDLTRAPDHCGRCGHSCLGGECQVGRCQPVLLASAKWPTGIATDGTWVYWTEDGLASEDTSVWRCESANCKPTRLSEPRDWATVIAVDTTNVYWVDNNGVRTCPNESHRASPTPVFEGSVRTVAIDETYTYWTDFTSSDGGALYQRDKARAHPAKVLVPSLGSNPLLAISTVASDGLNVYFTDYAKKTVSKCAVTGCDTPKELVSGQDAGPAAIAIDDTDVYWTLYEGGVSKCAKNGCTSPTVIATLSGGDNIAIAVDTTNVYWMLYKPHSGMLMRCPKTGCIGPPDVVADVVEPRAIALDEVSVFYTQADKVMRVAK